MIVRHSSGTHPASRGERRASEVLEHVPGVLLVNYHAVAPRAMREIDGVMLTPHGLVSLEVKGTPMHGLLEVSANSDWTIAGAKVDFRGGANPLPQARRGAQILRSILDEHHTTAPFIPVIVAVSGDNLDCQPERMGDTWVCLVEDLPATMLRMRRNPITLNQAISILKALGVEDITAEQLLREGFEDVEPEIPDTKHASGKENAKGRRRARKLSEMEDAAQATWRSSHNRRVIVSGIGCGVSLVYLYQLPYAAWLLGLAAMMVAILVQITMRRRLSGPRDHGLGSIVVWLITLGPFLGIGAAISMLTTLSERNQIGQVIVFYYAILVILGLVLTMFSGRCAYVYPPPLVLERHDLQGNPTGTFMLATANPLRTPRKHREVVVDEPPLESSTETMADGS